MFTLRNAGMSLPHKTLLEAIDLEFSAGQVYGLIGHNGSGKSTLLKLLTRHHSATQGKILLNNKSIAQFSARDYARLVAYLPQHLPTATSLTATELIAMGRYPWNGLLGHNRQADEAAINKALALTHTERFRHQIVDTLSGGERSRIWLAMCLAQESNFLLLDEPLAPLDIAHQIEVMALIRHLAETLNLGIIIVIHDINLAAQYCHQLVALRQGRLLRVGKPSEIMQREILHEIYHVDMHIIHHPDNHAPIALPTHHQAT